jgi:hypothetical protein
LVIFTTTSTPRDDNVAKTLEKVEEVLQPPPPAVVAKKTIEESPRLATTNQSEEEFEGFPQLSANVSGGTLINEQTTPKKPKKITKNRQRDLDAAATTESESESTTEFSESDEEPLAKIQKKKTKKKINTNLKYCQICFAVPQRNYNYDKHMRLHNEKEMSTLNLILSNEKRMRQSYKAYNNNDKFLMIQRILNRIKNESSILLKNHNIVKNSTIKIFYNFKKIEKETNCQYCGEFFETNFYLAKHFKSNQCVDHNEQTCSFCWIRILVTIEVKLIALFNECVLCGAKVKGLIYHLKVIDHSTMYMEGSDAKRIQ